MTDQPLTGVRVLDFSRILSGPYASLLLAELGAEVIKIERPDGGDDTRAWGPPFVDPCDEISAYFSALNRGKASVAIDLGSPGGLGAFQRLVSNSDVVIENFRPGVAEKYGLHHHALSEINPRIVTCAISGFGRTGALAELPGTEIVVAAMSGLMSVTGPRNGPPVRFGVAMTDIVTGLTAATRMVAAVNQARETGIGAHIDMSLYAAAIGALGTLVASSSVDGVVPSRWGSHHPSIVPYGGFPTADGDVITGVVNDRTWLKFCRTVGCVELLDDTRLSSNAGRVRHRDIVEQTISEHTRRWGSAELISKLRAAGLLAAPIRTVPEMVGDPDTQAMGLITGSEQYPTLLSTRVSGTRSDKPLSDAAALGADTRRVLREIAGLDEDEIEVLTRSGSVHQSPANQESPIDV